MKSLKIVKEFKLQVGVRGTPACREGKMEGDDLDIDAGENTRHISPRRESHKQGAFCSVGGKRPGTQGKQKRNSTDPAPGYVSACCIRITFQYR